MPVCKPSKAAQIGPPNGQVSGSILEPFGIMAEWLDTLPDYSWLGLMPRQQGKIM